MSISTKNWFTEISESDCLIYQKSNIIYGNGLEFWWFSCSEEKIDEKRKQASEFLDSELKKPKDRNRSWEYCWPSYLAYEIVTLKRFLRDFDLYSKHTLLQKKKSERALISIHGIKDEEKITNEAEIDERRGILVDKFRRYSMENPSFVHSGNKYIDDESFGETHFRFVFIPIERLFRWLVNESGIDPTWIPYKIREWVKEYPTENVPVPSAESNLVSHIEIREDTLAAIIAQVKADINFAYSPHQARAYLKKEPRVAPTSRRTGAKGADIFPFSAAVDRLVKYYPIAVQCKKSRNHQKKKRQ